MFKTVLHFLLVYVVIGCVNALRESSPEDTDVGAL